MSVAVFSVVLYVLQGLLSPVATQEIHASYRYAGFLVVSNGAPPTTLVEGRVWLRSC